MNGPLTISDFLTLTSHTPPSLKSGKSGSASFHSEEILVGSFSFGVVGQHGISPPPVRISQRVKNTGRIYLRPNKREVKDCRLATIGTSDGPSEL